MIKPLMILLMASIAVSGCSRWGKRNNPALENTTEVNELLPKSGPGILQRPEAEDISVPIYSLTELKIEQDAGGAIVYASGIAERQGAYAAALRPANEDLSPDDGVLSFQFVVTYPEYQTAVGSERSRKVVVGYDLSSQDISGVRSIRVTAQKNALESRRR